MAANPNAQPISALPQRWVRLSLPADLEAIPSDAVLDISSSPAYWGELLRGKSLCLAASVGADLPNALTEAQAAAFIEGDILATLSAIGDQKIDILVLQLGSRLEPHQVTGALNALHFAKQDGNAGSIALDLRATSEDGRQAETALQSGVDILLLEPTQPFLIQSAKRRNIAVVTPTPSTSSEVRS